MLEISWKHGGNCPLPNILVFPPDAADMRSIGATALVDTGATASAVTSMIADELALPITGKRPVISAHGEQHVARYLFRVGVMPDRPGTDTSAPYIFDVIDDFEIRAGLRFDALIGMDILRLCDFAIERSGKTVLRFG